MLEVPWDQIESVITTGDLIAFGGTGLVSLAVQRLCDGPVDHVGVALRTNGLRRLLPNHQYTLPIVWLIEAVIPRVRALSLPQRLAEYEDNVWWLPLGRDAKERCNYPRLTDYLLESIGRDYDGLQAIRVGFERPNRESDRSLFCSELAGFALDFAGLIRSSINPSDTDPVELCRWDLWDPIYHQIRGDKPKELPGYRTVPVMP